MYEMCVNAVAVRRIKSPFRTIHSLEKDQGKSKKKNNQFLANY